jgi:hypothetical protein
MTTDKLVADVSDILTRYRADVVLSTVRDYLQQFSPDERLSVLLSLAERLHELNDTATEDTR